MKGTASSMGTIALILGLVTFSASAQAPSMSDDFEAANLDPAWVVITEQYGTIGLSADQNHTPGGKQSLKLASLDGGQRNVILHRSLGQPTKGTASIWFYDAAPGQQTLYTSFSLINTTTNVYAVLGTQDFDAFCYKAFINFANAGAVYGPSASCGSFPGIETTSVQRSLGWHHFIIQVESHSVVLSIDSQTVFTYAGDLTFDAVELALSGPVWRPDGVAYFDDFSVGGCQVNPNDVSLFAAGPYSLNGKPTSMIAAFTPTDTSGLPIGLNASQTPCGFKYFNWEQMITNWPSPSTLASLNRAEFQQVLGFAPPSTFTAPPDFPDPPPGGYTYFVNRGWTGWDSYPFYYDANSSGTTFDCVSSAGGVPWALSGHETNDTLCFRDAPADPCLPGGSGCGGFAPQFSDLRFRTKLVGIDLNNKVTDLFSWDWISDFNGTSGGILVTSSLSPVDAGSGTGGVTITSINGVPQVRPSITCAVNPIVLWPPDGKQVPVTMSGLATAGTQALLLDSGTFAVNDSEEQVQPNGAIEIQRDGNYSFTTSLPAARDGNNKEGRHYTVAVSVRDRIGNLGSCSAVIAVPHDQGH